MRLSVRNGLKMITTTHYFSRSNRNTQLLDINNNVATTVNTSRRSKKNNLLLKQIKTTSLNKLNSIVFHIPIIANRNMLLYRKENSELDFYYRHNVYLSHLYISRQNYQSYPQ